MIKLQVYISDSCWTCDETRRVIAEISPLFPEVSVEVINVDEQPCPAHVFAVPTYLLDGLTIFLGNPTRQELRQSLANALITRAM
jgi:hypothetical protein